MKEPVVNNNLLIALFMNAKIEEVSLNSDKEVDHYLLDMGKDRTQNERYWASNTLKYYVSWDWLMPVVTKCRQLGAVIEIRDQYCLLNGVYFSDPMGLEEIANTYYAVSHFINSYNKVIEDNLKKTN